MSAEGQPDKLDHHVVLPEMIEEITPEMAEDLCERDVIVALTFWSGRDNRWHVDLWSDDLTTVDVTNVAGMEGLRHERVPLEDVLVVSVGEAADGRDT